MTLSTGTKLGRYEIRSKIGEGGMGEVYLAEDTELRRRVALKLLSPQTISDEYAEKRLVREARAVAKLDHPNICSIYEVGKADGRVPNARIASFCARLQAEEPRDTTTELVPL